MEQLNQTSKVATTSDLSTFVGASVYTPPVPEPAHRSLTDTVVSDHVDWTDRLFAIHEQMGFPDGFSCSPTVSPSYRIYPLNKLFDENTMLGLPQHKYYAYVYDYISVRVTLSEPKNLVGAVWTGWWAYQDFFDKNVEETFFAYISVEDGNNCQTFYNSPHTHIMPLGLATETAFTIPWTYKSPLMRTYANTFWGNTPSTRPVYGTPSVWFNLASDSYFVNSTTNAAKVKIFVKFSGLRFFGPGQFAHSLERRMKKSVSDEERRKELEAKRNGTFTKQSGLEAVAMAEVATVAASALGITETASTLNNLFSTPDEIDEISRFGTYDDPQAVQLAYVGDTISCDYSNLTPIFAPHLNTQPHPIPSVHQQLSRYQYLNSWTSSTAEKTYYNDPMNFNRNDSGKMTCGNYFRFYGMLNRYWRGTINFHFLVTGHPMVEVQARSTVRYLEDTSDLTSSSISTVVDQHISNFHGTKMITVPAPYLTDRDYMPVVDIYPNQVPDAYATYTTLVTFKLTVLSTMLDTVPVIPYFVFVSAADDFAFYQPIPPGLYNAAELAVIEKEYEPVTELLKQSKEARNRYGKIIDTGQVIKVAQRDKYANMQFEKQVFIPIPKESHEVQSTRFNLTNDPGTMVSLPNIIDYMKIWSRCVPFYDYDNAGDEEPTPDASMGFSYAYWYPPIDRTEDVDVNNSWYFTLDYVALLSTMFLYFRGEMAFKILISTTLRTQGGYVYASLGDVYNHTFRQQTHVPFGYDGNQVPPESNFGSGTVITPMDKQPVLEVNIPYRGSNVWSYANGNADFRPPALSVGLMPNAAVNHNIVLQGTDDKLADAMFRKVGPNFNLAVETVLPPGTMWIARGFDWSD
jgi:hypothetical protein